MPKPQREEERRFFSTTAVFGSRCIECKEYIVEGDQIVYDAKDKVAYCEGCGADLED